MVRVRVSYRLEIKIRNKAKVRDGVSDGNKHIPSVDYWTQLGT